MPHEHYQLTEFQHKTLMAVANGSNPVAFVVEAIPEDDAETVARLNKQVEEMNDLVQLGFLKDVSGKMAEAVLATKLKAGRGYKPYLITDIGFDMFNSPQKRMPV